MRPESECLGAPVYDVFVQRRLLPGRVLIFQNLYLSDQNTGAVKRDGQAAPVRTPW